MSRVLLALSVAQASWLSHVLSKHSDEAYGRIIFHQLDRELSLTPADVSSESDSDDESGTSSDDMQAEHRPHTPENRPSTDVGSPMAIEEQHQQPLDIGSPIQVDNVEAESDSTPTRRPVARDSSRRVVPIPDSPTTFVYRTPFLVSNLLQDDITGGESQYQQAGEQRSGENDASRRVQGTTNGAVAAGSNQRDGGNGVAVGTEVERTLNGIGAGGPVAENQPLSSIARGIIAKPFAY
ncbi:hypothetical protein BDN72DRAFT_907158 [Pluteus cervinus]|uniref:Uncharacterized protein n=1 Tax=Pluteus cervinus TaxID=181527 RepID=A0ACD2ZXF2_9AGAR|nr:hypothetical protein BDN72DRAFT_907158 [Pluteus cervinus]